MPHRLPPVFTGLLLAAVLPLQAAEPDRAARNWAASCAACHGTDGRGQGSLPALAGRDAQLLLAQLLAFKQGQRSDATVMHQHAKGYSDEQLKRLAAFFAALPAQP